MAFFILMLLIAAFIGGALTVLWAISEGYLTTHESPRERALRIQVEALHRAQELHLMAFRARAQMQVEAERGHQQGR